MPITIKSRPVVRERLRSGRLNIGGDTKTTTYYSSGGGGGDPVGSWLEDYIVFNTNNDLSIIRQEGTFPIATMVTNPTDGGVAVYNTSNKTFATLLDLNINSIVLESIKLGSGESGALVRDLMFTEDGIKNGIGWYNTSLATSASIYRNASSEFIIGARGGTEGNGIKIDVGGNLITGLNTHVLGGFTVENASLFNSPITIGSTVISESIINAISGDLTLMSLGNSYIGANDVTMLSVGDDGYVSIYNTENFESTATNNIFQNIIRSSTYKGDEFDGYGWKVTPDDGNSNSLIVTDNLIVRKQFRVFEMQISRLEHIGAMLCLSAARGIVESFSSLGTPSFRLFFDTKNGNNPIQFVTNDIVYAQDYTGDTQGSFKAIVVAVNQSSGYIDVTAQTGSPFVGMHLVQKGNTNDPNRQAMIFMNSLGTPYIRLWDDMTTGEFADGTLLASYGDLSDIVSPAHGQLSGTGLYAQNAYLENAYFSGVVEITGGNAETIDTNIYCRGTGLNNNASRILKIGENTIYNTSSDRGLRLTVINRSSLSVISDVTYDVYGGSSERTALANAMNALSYDVFIVLTSYDAITIDDNLSSAIKRCGGSGLLFQGRNPYVLIGIPGISSGKGLETYRGVQVDQPYAEISTRCKNGMIEGMNVSVLGIANDNAQSYADSAESNANNYSDTVSATAEANAKAYTDALENTLGAVAYEDLIETSKLGTTVIEGGYLKTNLINTDWIFAQQAIIGSWYINPSTLNSSDNRAFLSATNHLIGVALNGDDVLDEGSVYMKYSSSSDWGLYGYNSSGSNVFRLGSTNKIAGFVFDNDQMWVPSPYGQASEDSYLLLDAGQKQVRVTRTGDPGEGYCRMYQSNSTNYGFEITNPNGDYLARIGQWGTGAYETGAWIKGSLTIKNMVLLNDNLNVNSCAYRSYLTSEYLSSEYIAINKDGLSYYNIIPTYDGTGNDVVPIKLPADAEVGFNVKFFLRYRANSSTTGGNLFFYIDTGDTSNHIFYWWGRSSSGTLNTRYSSAYGGYDGVSKYGLYIGQKSISDGYYFELSVTKIGNDAWVFSAPGNCGIYMYTERI